MRRISAHCAEHWSNTLRLMNACDGGLEFCYNHDNLKNAWNAASKELPIKTNLDYKGWLLYNLSSTYGIPLNTQQVKMADYWYNNWYELNTHTDVNVSIPTNIQKLFLKPVKSFSKIWNKKVRAAIKHSGIKAIHQPY